MASKPINLLIKPRGKRISRLPKETTTYLQGSTGDLYHRIAAEARFSIHRLRITKEDGALVPNDKTTSVESLGLKDGSVVQVKDLGLQISWRTVFIIEYLGPLIIHPLVYLLRPLLYGPGTPEASLVQTLTCAMVSLHFLKRELETMFVHRFSNATMPAANIVKNSAHYWLLAGVLIAYATYSPTAPAAAAVDPFPVVTWAGVALFVVGELGNLNTHLVLRGLRSAGGTERGIPFGLGFAWVTCPNYLFEAIAWLGMILVSRSWATVVFTAVAMFFMIRWAMKKERRYRAEMGSRYKKKRFVMLPGII